MILKNILFTVLALFLCSCATMSANTMSYRELNEVMNASVEIEYGSGTVIYYDSATKYAILVTAHHVIDKKIWTPVNLKLRFLNACGETCDPIPMLGTVLAYSAASDVALVGFYSSKRINPVPVADKDVDMGDFVYVVGNPMGTKSMLARGIVSNKSYINRSGIKMWQIDAKIVPGNSGGGVFNSNGELVGMPIYVSTYNIPIYQKTPMGPGRIMNVYAGPIYIPHMGMIATRSSICSILHELPGKFNILKCK